MFEKSLTDVVKGIRASKRDTSKYISQCIAEIKTEINSNDMNVKANALNKLTFLQMMGFSMNYASFATIEVMSSSKFEHKRIGYLAASQGFTQDTEVILLTTNLLKKELRGAVGAGTHCVYDAGLAINCISNIVTEDLARDLLQDLTNLTSHPQPYLRKKAILCLFKLFVKYPQGLRLTFARLQQCLDDPNSSVVSCAVNVITELSDKNPKNYLHLAPAFFDLLTKSSNNWMLIKVVKLLGSLVPEEPRLARKLLDPLAAIVRSTQAKSLLYESVRTITLCLPYCRKSDGSMPQNVPAIVELCADTLLDFVKQVDQNLKYLGLVGFGSLMQSHPKVLSDPKYKPLVLKCLSDEDVTIRRRALDLLLSMASRKNLMELVSQLLDHVEYASGTYKLDLVTKIVEICSSEKYALLQDFQWYLDILFNLGHMRGIERRGDIIREQITNVALRVLPVRGYAVRKSIEVLLEGENETSDNDLDNGRGKQLMIEILPAAAWIVGEYSDLIREAMDGDEFSFNDNSKGTYHAIIQCLTVPSNTQKLPTTTQKIYLQAAMKVFAAAANDKRVRNSELEQCLKTLHHNFHVYLQSLDVEVVERSYSFVELLKSLGLVIDVFNFSPTKTDDSESSDYEEVQGDLLGMGSDPVQTNGTKQPKSNSASSKSLSTKIRDAAEILSQMLKPAPMKPSGAKAQRKKRQTPNTATTVDLDAPVDLSIIKDLISEEKQLKKGIVVDSVTFTQQHPFKVEEKKVETLPPVNDMPGTSISPTLATTNFGNNTPATAPRPRQGDPFYLDSAQSSDKDDENQNGGRFGTIQLLDSDDEEDHGANDKRKKKKRSKKTKSKEWPSTPMFPSSSSGVAVYESEDEENDGDVSGLEKRKRPGKEFAGLAKVDLTTPLREDEVMPERTHRVVPEKPATKAPNVSKREKKPKKEKKKSKQKEITDTVGDLLDLDAVFSNPPQQQPQTAAQTQQASNPIDSAFDLLGDFTTPAPAPLLPNTSQPSLLPNTNTTLTDFPNSNKKSSSKRPWVKASLKPSSDSSGPVDWSKISVFTRLYRSTDGGSMSAKMVIRVDNNSSTPLTGVSIDLKDRGYISLGNIAPMASCESDKVGTFPYSNSDASQDIKAHLVTSGLSSTVKIHLPICFFLHPESALSLDQVARELSTADWSNNTAKCSVNQIRDPSEIKDVICNFLRAEFVQGSAMDNATGTYAARTSNGSPVRFLLKVKDGSVKVDIKAKDSSFGKALASDIKRLVL